MQTKSTTAPPSAQVPDGDLPICAPTASNFTDEQRQVVVQLIKAERQHASRWWGLLNDMRCNKQLPAFLADRLVGSHPEWDKWNDACLATNACLFGSPSHINCFDHKAVTVERPL